MDKIILLVSFFIITGRLTAQTVYTGFIGESPVEMVIDSDSGTADAVYAYTNYDEPIRLNNGIIKNGRLIFNEKEGKLTKAVLTFENFTTDKNTITGVWKNLKTKNELKITLTKKYAVENGENIQWADRELLQPESTKDKYFKVVLSKEKDGYYPTITAVKVYEKRTDKLLQKIDVECSFLGLDNINIEDYNFDGTEDFSIFEASYAGPNTSRIYYLYNKATQQYYESGFSGVSLEFDQKKKRIYERNQCCAGTIVTTAEYKVVKDNMVLLNQHCYRWDDRKQKLVEKAIKACQ
ncbi:hypothetical protein I6H88_13365 [Elizabethkingia bruuniana]|uniref:Uncharacterized protein n=1 Tax=Elizabethkingia bruuniana TaxID=1756149 RepID=A0A7T7ZWN4_9FLAO|nr:hypothetical protein [Elizabethkingia bruuniana]AQX83951.1 hypothetical protein AYC65_02465 [Elizabethkingia bruuniana]KUY28202.1 hypothetical protein ATB97_14850 [Elizabethkingia bruuniana]OPB64370.1 hypothetical protein BAY12_06105 [Elizabethkingia bruuniana]QDZ63310.1 hypothetical protein EVD20_12605 [Elizabethkingia bruuniana]QQN57432.1 hypothetical protein I6H88_13365 [Elizabethkingia bruuniana]